jgi:hypothetical protein
MLILVAALAVAAADRPITPKERAIIEQAVKPELETPGTLSIPKLPAAATIVCGRVNGDLYKVSVIRDAAGRIVSAQQATVMTVDKLAFHKQAVMSMCSGQGYDLG